MDEDQTAMSDDLEKLGFEFCDEDCMYKYIIPNGPQLVVSLHNNSRRDDYMLAKSLSLFQKYDKVQLTFDICDDPTPRQVKLLLDCLTGEFKFLTEFNQLTEAYNRAKSS